MVSHSGFNWIPDHISKKTPCGTGYCRENWIFIFVFVRWQELIYKASSGLCLIELTGLKHLPWPEQRKGVGIEDPGFTTLVSFFWNLSFGLPAVDLPGFFSLSQSDSLDLSHKKSHCLSNLTHTGSFTSKLTVCPLRIYTGAYPTASVTSGRAFHHLCRFSRIKRRTLELLGIRASHHSIPVKEVRVEVERMRRLWRRLPIKLFDWNSEEKVEKKAGDRRCWQTALQEAWMGKDLRLSAIFSGNMIPRYFIPIIP